MTIRFFSLPPGYGKTLYISKFLDTLSDEAKAALPTGVWDIPPPEHLNPQQKGAYLEQNAARWRRAFCMRAFDGLTYAEIGKRLGVCRQQARYLARRGKADLDSRNKLWNIRQSGIIIMTSCNAVPLIAKKMLPWLKFSRAIFAAGLPQPIREHKFCESRQWRFDYAWPDKLIALEVEGGVWMGSNKHSLAKGKKSRHFSGKGATADMEKYNEAAALGWRVFRCTPQDLDKPKTLDSLRRVLAGHPA